MEIILVIILHNTNIINIRLEFNLDNIIIITDIVIVDNEGNTLLNIGQKNSTKQRKNILL